MADNSTDPITKWQERSRSQLESIALTLTDELRRILDAALRKKELDDVTFVSFVRLAILDCNDNLDAFARASSLDRQAVKQWIDGNNLPPAQLRQSILQLCSLAMPTLANTGGGLQRIVMLVKPMRDDPYAVYRQELAQIPSWADLPKRVQNPIKNDEIITLGDLLSTPADELWRISNLGSAGRELIAQWLEEYGGYTTPASRIEVPSSLVHWKAFHRPLEPITGLLQKDICETLAAAEVKTYGSLAMCTQEQVRTILGGIEHMVTLKEVLRREHLSLGMTFPWA